ncbi:MAG: lysostaphin resistance A-like protein [Anaerolineae bacterium]
METSAQASILTIKPRGPYGDPVGWSVRDAWVGAVLMVVLLFLTALAAGLLLRSELLPSALKRYSITVEFAAPIAVELANLAPVLAILAWRRAGLRTLGFRGFDVKALALGCGLTAVTYMVIMVYGATLTAFHIQTQGEKVFEILRTAKAPLGYVVAAVIAAPLAEETFFRGFLFQGLRQKYGWNIAALLSSSLFAAMHLELAALLPTFLLGYLLAFVYHRSNSLWPGIILHFLVNSFAMCLVLALLPFVPKQPEVYSFVMSLAWLS